VLQLFVVTAIAAIPCAWYSLQLQAYRREQQIVAEVTERGLVVRRERRGIVATDRGRVVSITPDFELEAVMIVDDRLLEQIASLEYLEHLSLANTSVQADSLRALARCKRLVSMNVDGTCMGNKGVDAITHLTQLQELCLNYTGRTYCSDATTISTASLNRLSTLPALRSLHIAGTNASDDTLRILAGNPRLKFINVEDTLVTRDGIAAFTRLRPDVDIVSDQRLFGR
jgi:hypothetical protein